MTGRLIAPVIPRITGGPIRPRAAGPRTPASATARPLPTAVAPECRVPPIDVRYRLARIDASGRICDRAVLDILGWCTGNRLALAAASGLVLIRRDQDGDFTLPPRPRIAIPAGLRRRSRLRAGDHVLLAAYLSLDALAAYSLTVVDQALHPLTRHPRERSDQE